MRKSLVVLPMAAILANSGCSDKKQGDGAPVDTTLPANTQAIGGVPDASDAADLNAAANDAIADVNAAEQEFGGSASNDLDSLGNSTPPDANLDDGSGQPSSPPVADDPQ